MSETRCRNEIKTHKFQYFILLTTVLNVKTSVSIFLVVLRTENEKILYNRSIFQFLPGIPFNILDEVKIYYISDSLIHTDVIPYYKKLHKWTEYSLILL